MISPETKRAVHDTLELIPGTGTVGRCFQGGIVGAIVLSVAAVLIDSDHEAHEIAGPLLGWFIYAITVVFAAEISVRIWLFDAGREHRRRHSHPLWGRLRYIASPTNLFDLIALFALLPWIDDELVVLRTFRLIRVLRFTPYGAAIESLEAVLYTERRALVGVCVMLMLMLVVASTLVFVAERGAQPEAFASIPHAMWWGLATLTTVGYGDIAPVTALGRVMGGVVTIIGVGMFALPAAILASGYTREFRRRGFVETWDLVAEVPLFSGLPAARIADLAAMLKPRLARTGEIIVREGEPAESMFFVVSGSLEVELQPEPVILHGGDFFGEIALIDHGPRVATVAALEDSRLLVLDAQDLARFLDNNPELQKVLNEMRDKRRDGLEGEAQWPVARSRSG